jgi:hypothetical protein
LRPDAASAPFFSGKEERGRAEDEFEDFEDGLEPLSPDNDEPSFLGL